MAKRIRIVLADDHDAIRETVSSLLKREEDFDVAGEACHGEEVVRLVQQSPPDVVIMDVSMPVMNGMEATRILRHSHPEVKVIAFSSHDTRSYVLGMLRAGASGYVLKPCSEAELGRAIRVALRGDVYISPGLHGILIDQILRMDEDKNAP